MTKRSQSELLKCLFEQRVQNMWATRTKINFKPGYLQAEMWLCEGLKV